jgi:altronate dehydratase
MKALQIISDRDNVATALEPLEPGRQLAVGETVVIVREAIPRGHKIAVRTIGTGEAVIKYGCPIGLAAADIPAGTHVHIHNVSSTRGRGDLGPQQDQLPQPRLAEPPD